MVVSQIHYPVVAVVSLRVAGSPDLLRVMVGMLLMVLVMVGVLLLLVLVVVVG